MRAGISFRHDQRGVCHVFDRNLSSLGKRMAFRNCDDRSFIKQMLVDKPRVAHLWRPDNCDVQTPRQQSWQKPDGFLLKQFDVNLGMSFTKMGQKLRNKTCGRAVDGTDPKDRRLILSAVPERRLKPVRLFDQVARRFDKIASRLRQRDTARCPDKQTRTQAFFQKLDMPSQRGRQHIQALRRFSKMQRVRDGDKAPELTEFHSETIISFFYMISDALCWLGQVAIVARNGRSAHVPRPEYPQETMMRTYKIAAIPADGIGPEVIDAGTEVLSVLAQRAGDVRFDVTTFDWGSDYYKKTGVMMPEDGLEQLKPFDAIYFGAVGAPDVPDHITLWGLRLPICQGFDQYANVRPTKIIPGVTSPLRGVGVGDLDWVIVRENSEGEYSGHGGRAHRGMPEEVGTEVSIFTRVGVTRIMRYAFQLAQSRPRKFLTVVTKSNAQRFGMVMWDEIAAEVAQEFPDVTWDKMLVDAMTVRMVKNPQSLDTIVATNLHADILSDLAGALAGSLGVAPTANIDPERRFPSMFEPIHGSAFDITGKGIANPVATFWTASQMLDHLGEAEASARLMRAVEKVCAEGILTPDVGGTATTKEVTEAVCEAIRGENI